MGRMVKCDNCNNFIEFDDYAASGGLCYECSYNLGYPEDNFEVPYHKKKEGRRRHYGRKYDKWGDWD